MVKRRKKKKEFSKNLLVQESILIWIISLACIVLAFKCLKEGYYTDLTWVATMIACPWTAYGVSQAFYYKKSEKENTKDGIKYATVLAELQQQQQQNENAVG